MFVFFFSNPGWYVKHTPEGVDWRQNIWDQTHTHTHQQRTQLTIVTNIIEREFVATAILSYNIISYPHPHPHPLLHLMCCTLPYLLTVYGLAWLGMVGVHSPHLAEKLGQLDQHRRHHGSYDNRTEFVSPASTWVRFKTRQTSKYC